MSACSEAIVHGSTSSTVKTILGAAGLLYKLGLAPTPPPLSAALFVPAARRLAGPARPRLWADPASIAGLARRASSHNDLVLVALAVLSFALGLRACEAAGLRGSDLEDAIVGRIRFRPAKKPPGSPLCERPLMAFPKMWATWLLFHLQRTFPEWRDHEVFPGPSALHSSFRALRAGTSLEGHGWHCWRRGCARTLWECGATSESIQNWCRWSSGPMVDWYVGDARGPSPMQSWDLPVPPYDLAHGVVSSLWFDSFGLWPSHVAGAPRPAREPTRKRGRRGGGDDR